MSSDDQFIAAAQGNVDWLRRCLEKNITQYNCNVRWQIYSEFDFFFNRKQS